MTTAGGAKLETILIILSSRSKCTTNPIEVRKILTSFRRTGRYIFIVNQNQNNSKDRRLHNYDDEYQNKRYEKIYPEEWAKPEYYHGNGPYKYY